MLGVSVMEQKVAMAVTGSVTTGETVWAATEEMATAVEMSPCIVRLWEVCASEMLPWLGLVVKAWETGARSSQE